VLKLADSLLKLLLLSFEIHTLGENWWIVNQIRKEEEIAQKLPPCSTYYIKKHIVQ
jgi:hypothetical protein